MNESLFIPAEKLGELIYNRCSTLSSPTSKRARGSALRIIERMMVALHVIPKDKTVLSVGVGVRSDGEIGVTIAFENTQIASKVPNA